MKKEELDFINGLRGIAILMVMGVHTSIAATAVTPFSNQTLFSWLLMGSRGVQLFFMVSAFTLFMSWNARKGTEATPWTNFYIRRATRILPMWWIACLLYMHAYSKPLHETVATAFFYFGFMQHAVPSVVPGGWSIFAEEAFYFFLPLLALALTTAGRAGVFFATALVAQSVWWTVAGIYKIPSANDALFYMPINHLFAFAAGVFLYQIWRKLPSGKMEGIQYDALALASAYFFWTYNSEVLLGSIPLFFIFAGAMVNSPLFGRITRTRIVGAAGKYCYSAYLLHYLIYARVVGHLNETMIAQPAELRALIGYPIVVMLSLGVSAAVYHVLEKPVIDWGKRLIARRESGRVNAALTSS